MSEILKLLSEPMDRPEESESGFNILDCMEAHTASFSRLKSYNLDENYEKASWLLDSQQKVTGGGWVRWVRGR